MTDICFLCFKDINLRPTIIVNGFVVHKDCYEDDEEPDASASPGGDD